MAIRPRTHVVKWLSYILHADSEYWREVYDRRKSSPPLRRSEKKKKQTVSSGKHMAPYDRDSLTAEKRSNASEEP